MRRQTIRFLVLFCSGALSASVLIADPAGIATDYRLVDQNGKSFHLHALRGKPLLVSFVYSRCPMPEMCPLTLSLTARLVDTLKRRKMAGRVRVLLVTLDPENDDAKALKELGRRHHLDFRQVTFATGEPRAVRSLAYDLSVIGIQQGDFIAHNLRTVLLDRSLTPVRVWEDNHWDPETVLTALPAAETVSAVSARR
jgi:protein SCO1/2